ncbi:CENPK protein, partial [Grantiella picta]|nr:CENPK protein [Grantiella picta]
LQKVKNDLEMLLSTVRVKNKQLDEELKREQQWYEEQKELLNTVTKIEEEVKTQAEQPPTQSLNTKEFDELKNKVLKLNIYKKELLSDLGAFLDEHFPPPEKGENKKKKKCSAKPAVELISLREIIEILINKMVSTPHDPYITINESFWPPYIEVLLRYGVALRHPEDPNRMRLEAFHK